MRYHARYVKEADKDIIKHLRGLGRLMDSSNYTHSYPFCWRSDTPLIQRVGISTHCTPACLTPLLASDGELTSCLEVLYLRIFHTSTEHF